MTHTQILQKAIAKAVEGGWKSPWQTYHYPLVYSEFGVWNKEDPDNFTAINDIIYNHEFAKALWGEEDIEVYNPPNMCAGDFAHSGASYYGPAYEYHLMLMVVSEDPIAYLGEHI